MSVKMRTNENGITEYKEMKESIPLNQKVYLTVPEAALYSGLAYHLVYSIISRPDVNFIFKQGRKNYVHREKFEEYISNLTNQ